MSGPHRPGHGVATEVEDVAAVLATTSARLVFGLSSGAIVMLEAALALPTIERAVIVEPPLAVDGVVAPDWPDGWLDRFDREIAAGDLAAAMVTAMRGGQLGPRILDLVPRWLLEGMTRRMLSSETRTARPGYVTVGALAPTLHHDMRLIIKTKGRLDRYREIDAEVLLLNGTKSRPPFLQDGQRPPRGGPAPCPAGRAGRAGSSSVGRPRRPPHRPWCKA